MHGPGCAVQRIARFGSGISSPVEWSKPEPFYRECCPKSLGRVGRAHGSVGRCTAAVRRLLGGLPSDLNASSGESGQRDTAASTTTSARRGTARTEQIQTPHTQTSSALLM